jgi:hypothetical protein
MLRLRTGRSVGEKAGCAGFLATRALARGIALESIKA